MTAGRHATTRQQHNRDMTPVSDVTPGPTAEWTRMHPQRPSQGARCRRWRLPVWNGGVRSTLQQCSWPPGSSNDVSTAGSVVNFDCRVLPCRGVALVMTHGFATKFDRSLMSKYYRHNFEEQLECQTKANNRQWVLEQMSETTTTEIE